MTVYYILVMLLLVLSYILIDVSYKFGDSNIFITMAAVAAAGFSGIIFATYIA